MNFLFVAPRFHTNQIPIVKSLMAEGHNVRLFVQYNGKSEDHSVLKPYFLKRSILSILFHKFIDMKYKVNKAENIKASFFIPAVAELVKLIKTYNPDIVILRERNITSMFVYFICKLMKTKCTIIYNQTPLYSLRGKMSGGSSFSTRIKRNVRLYCFPRVRMTTVYAKNIVEFKRDKNKYYAEGQNYFIPFISELNERARNREYCINGKINILDVGKYRDYKNHYILVDAINLIKDKSRLEVTIVGQVANKEEQEYYESLNCYIEEKKLTNVIKLEKNIEFNKMNELYLKNDVFILTSKIEAASIAVLEAMANGMVTISTDANGTGSYINEGSCGYLFRTMDANDLASKIELIMDSDVRSISEMGKNAFENIEKNYSFENYYLRLDEMLNNEFGIRLKSSQKGLGKGENH